MRSDLGQQGSAPGSDAAAVRNDSFLDTEREHHHDESILAHDESSAIIMLGSFVAGALVGAIICLRVFRFAPIVVVLLCGAGAAVLTKSDSKAGKISRGVGKWTSDVLLALFRFVREFNHKHQLTDKVRLPCKTRRGRQKPRCKSSVSVTMSRPGHAPCGNKLTSGPPQLIKLQFMEHKDRRRRA